MTGQKVQNQYVIPALFIRTNKTVKFIPFESILYLKAEGNYTIIFVTTGNERFLSACTLGSIEDRINCPFIQRVHRSYIINLKQVTGMIGNAIKIGNNIIPVGRTYKDVFKSFIIL